MNYKVRIILLVMCALGIALGVASYKAGSSGKRVSKETVARNAAKDSTLASLERTLARMRAHNAELQAEVDAIRYNFPSDDSVPANHKQCLIAQAEHTILITTLPESWWHEIIDHCANNKTDAEALKLLFVKGARPSGEDFKFLLDACLNTGIHPYIRKRLYSAFKVGAQPVAGDIKLFIECCYN